VAGLKATLVAILIGSAVALAACSGDQSGIEASSTTAAPSSSTPQPAEQGVPGSDTAVDGASADRPLWTDVTTEAIGKTGEWTNKLELADIDVDGDVDLLFANGGDSDSPGRRVLNYVFANDGNGVFEDVSIQVLGDRPGLTRVIKVHDLNGDGLPDIFLGGAFQTASRLFLGRGGLDFEEVTEAALPTDKLSVGDAEAGDVDGDGDLDLVLSDWGRTDSSENEGAVPRLWLNDGQGRFTDVTDTRIPPGPVGSSWELELVDVDNDFDLDLLVSCVACFGSRLYHNNGAGRFTDVFWMLPQYPNNYDFEPIDLDRDGFLDLVTINDGAEEEEHVFLADGKGGFKNGTPIFWPRSANLGIDDNMAVVLDSESDGDPDILIGSLNGPDRLLLNDGTGRLSLRTDVFQGAHTSGTLAIGVADLNGDRRLDVVQAQGDVNVPEKVYFGTGIPRDTAAPVIGPVVAADGMVLARVHDNKSPTSPSDWESVQLIGPEGPIPMQWYGEYLWRAPAGPAGEYRVCATDRAGNQACSR
jgi:FG-GAP-like repeat